MRTAVGVTPRRTAAAARACRLLPAGPTGTSERTCSSVAFTPHPRTAMVKAAGPQSLDDLVSSGYLREVPTDPMTRGRDWHTDSDSVLLSVDQTSPGITDVHSTSDTVSPFENTSYSSW